ncbi:NifB/NifX family molybdenum-iron cluster-binding protein [Candidatus Bipolaricaulota sp. J31]
MTRVFVAATDTGGPGDRVFPVFGRAPTFTVVEVEDSEIKKATVLQNPYASAPSGAGIQAAQFVVEQGARVVFAGNFGPNASGVLAQAGVEMVPVAGLTVREAVEKYLKGELAPMAAPAPGAGYGPGMGMGRGRGRGRGMGGYGPPPPPPPGGPVELDELRARIERLERELEEVRSRLGDLRGGG